MLKEKRKILILCVDRDNDIGVKTNIKTPIIGRENNLEAASNLALIDPEESDANAIFGAVRTYDTLSEESGNEEYEVATIVGSEQGGIKADKQITNQLIEVLTRYPAHSVILVTDGFSDEEVLPIVQSHAQILSIKRIVVKHSERIEESWAVLSRYFMKLIEDQYYSRWFLGAPGLLLVALAILWYFAREYVGMVFLVFVGTLLVVKGFSIDEKIEEWIFPSPPNLIRFFTAATASIIIGLDSYQTYVSILEFFPDISLWREQLPKVIGYTMYFATNLMVVAFCILLAGIAIYSYLMHDSKLWWSIVGIVATLWMREVSLRASDILLSSSPIPEGLIQNLIIVVGLGIVTTLISILATLNLSKRFESYFKRYEDKRDEKS